MARYIDAEEITRRIVYYYGHTNEGSGEHYAYSVALKEINRTPTADVVEVVRCKDCKHWHPFKAVYCRGNCENTDNGLFEFTKPDDFCSYGERSEQNG